ncbi:MULTISPECIES: Rne/Rng family ribonuclease [unclassified Novosphingobium]|uniref:Rne/Rng family ribonuclease n=1 Tax=unclassified Novosphingobium TaxID=2644732 RepID=UPI00086EFEF9|nr:MULTISPECIES: ribonuclease E/G [unclassified Novosphingobium]MBN9145771.1 ribonuclease E/G [Novosphingobium sp.]MDR6706515.1 ribonuclease E [Novosphingobium sp. 1748]ODU82339.1 MAG: ribonuclease [Novosphingobium sp. SCN 63-17]OJX97161.1 MAG: ribonuclease E/G [Novosphingobium sp. 63-713]
MSTRMLIDARHSEETRVAVLKGNRIEEFDFDSADHKQIKGNIYLAKVTRVEPSLQAAFVDFGGNRHGFLAFSEIHPDYYQIPKEDREALLAEEAAHAEEEAALRAVAEGEEDFVGDDDLGEGLADDFAGGSVEDAGSLIEVDTSEKGSVATIEAGHIEDGFDGDHEAEEASESEEGGERRGRRGRRQGGRNATHAKEAEELRAKRMALRRRYKIQDVIHRRQVLLVQVVKEERGNKGAALTTYLSLAGRYCVLMPNSSHGGGISRKISSFADRKRLKTIIAEMDLPKSMGCIVRTAGLQRTKTEIKRDFDYLARLWDDIRENTLKSAAPALIHSDSDLIKRAIRDIYNRDIEEVIVEGDDGYRAARDFMKLLMPSHARRVKHYADPVPLFQRFGAEDQLTAMYDPVVQLKSGGYIVINPTEALVSIDINSGRSTKEHGIEQTAVATNLEAAREIARQLRLRDMAGLVVIDFIDMEYGSNVRKVEKAMKEALKNDRARIQVGRISSFGLMEMSRQRLRTGVLEATTRSCPHCDGTGLVRTAGSAGLSALRLIEEEAAKGKGTIITLFASQEASIYLLNAKRIDLGEIEHRYGVSVEVIPEGENEGAKMRVVSSGPRNEFVPKFEPLVLEEDLEDLPEEDFEDEIEEEAEEAEAENGGESADGRRKRRKRRRGRGRDRREDGTAEEGVNEGAEPVEGEEGDEAEEAEGDTEAQSESAEAGEEGPRKRRRRKRRRSRNRGEGEEGTSEEQAEAGEDEADAAPAVEAVAEPVIEAVAAPVEAAPVEAAPAEPVAEEVPAKPKRVRRKKVDAAPVEAVVEAAPAEAAPAEPVAEEAPAKPKRVRRKKADAAPVEAVVEVAPAEPVAEEAPAKPKRVRRKKADAAPVEAPVEAAPAEVAVEAAPVETPTEATPAAEDDASASPRRGWWQRTFGE